MNIVIIGSTSGSMLGFRGPLIEKLVRDGHVVHALAMDYDFKSRQSVRKLGAFPIEYKLDRTSKNPFADLSTTFQLWKIIKQIGPDLVFCYFVKPVIFGTFAAWLARVPRRIAMIEGLGFVFTDEPGGISKGRRFLRLMQIFLYRLALPRASHVIFLNQDDPKELIHKFRVRVRNYSVLGGIGLNLRQFPYSHPVSSPAVFMFIGRLLREKGIFEFVDAARIVKSQYPQSKFIVLGGIDGSNPGSISIHDLENLSSSGIIEYPGAVTNVASWLERSSVFVLPSFYREGVPRSTQEAMATGRPVITTNVPGCRETVEDGVNGFLVRPWDSQALAERMIWFIENPDHIEKMGLASHRKAVENYDAEKVNKRMTEILYCGQSDRKWVLTSNNKSKS